MRREFATLVHFALEGAGDARRTVLAAAMELAHQSGLAHETAAAAKALVAMDAAEAAQLVFRDIVKAALFQPAPEGGCK